MRQKLIELIQTCGDAVVRSKNITLNIFSPDKKSNLQIIAIINGLVLTCVNFALLDEYIVINCFENDKFRTYKILYNEITVH